MCHYVLQLKFEELKRTLFYYTRVADVLCFCSLNNFNTSCFKSQSTEKFSIFTILEK